MLPLAIPDLSGNEARYLQECVATGFVSSVGPFVGRFEEMIAKAAGVKQAVVTTSGTVGLHLALVSAGVKPGDLVIIPSFTFIASANAVSHCGASPWIFDVCADSWNLDAQQVAQALAQETTQVDGVCLHNATNRPVTALMPVHTLGLAADMDGLKAVAQKHGLKLIADAACALGALYKGQPISAAGADLSVFSFNGNKTITSGGGGAIVGNNKDMLDLARHLSTTARKGPGYDHDKVGYNYRMTNLQAAVGCAQMERLDIFLKAKRRIRAAYDNAFADIKGVTAFPGGSGDESACWLSGVVTKDSNVAEKIRENLRAADIEAKPFWKPIHLQTPYRDAPKSAQNVSGALWDKIVTLPSSSNLTLTEQEKVIAVVRKSLT